MGSGLLKIRAVQNLCVVNVSLKIMVDMKNIVRIVARRWMVSDYERSGKVDLQM